MILIIDDDEIMAGCVARACGDEVRVEVVPNAIEAMGLITDGELPDLIFLDILLDGPDGFTFLNEMVSYTDTARVPVVLVSTLDFKDKDLSMYGVVGILDKAKMVPAEIRDYVRTYVG